MSRPRPPRNARYRYPDGRIVPVELVYAGTDGDGVAVWRATVPWTEQDGELLVDVLPARTAIVVNVRR